MKPVRHHKLTQKQRRARWVCCAASRRASLVALKSRLPLMSRQHELVEAGCLISYGANIQDNYRRAAIYVDKILKGAKPADLPVEQPVSYELVINLKTAKAFGITIPQAVLLRADRMID